MFYYSRLILPDGSEFVPRPKNGGEIDDRSKNEVVKSKDRESVSSSTNSDFDINRYFNKNHKKLILLNKVDSVEKDACEMLVDAYVKQPNIAQLLHDVDSRPTTGSSQLYSARYFMFRFFMLTGFYCKGYLGQQDPILSIMITAMSLWMLLMSSMLIRSNCERLITDHCPLQAGLHKRDRR